MSQVWHAATTAELRSKWIETIQRLNLEWLVAQGKSGSQVATASLPGVEGSQASVVQINAPDQLDTLPTVGEAAEDATAGLGPESPSYPEAFSPAKAGSPSAAPSTRNDSESAPDGAAEGQPAYPDPPSPTLDTSHTAGGILSESDSESGMPDRPARHSTSTKASSRDEVDAHVLVEASQSKSRELSSSSSSSAPSELFSSQPGPSREPIVPDTLEDVTPVPDSSEDERGRIDLSGGDMRGAVPRAAVSSPGGRRNSSHFGSSPPALAPSSPTRRPKRPRASRARDSKDGFTQQTLASFRVNGAAAAAAVTRSSSPEPAPAPREQRKVKAPEPAAANARAPPIATYKGRAKRTVSGVATGGSEPKRPRSNTPQPAAAPAAGNSSQNPIDIDPSDEDA